MKQKVKDLELTRLINDQIISINNIQECKCKMKEFENKIYITKMCNSCKEILNDT